MSVEGRLTEIMCYMAASARNCVDETKMYGPLRLVEAIGRIIDCLEEEGASSEELRAIREEIEAGKYLVMTDRDGFVKMLDEVVRRFSDVLAGT